MLGDALVNRFRLIFSGTRQPISQVFGLTSEKLDFG